jgi:hypothetical protein
MLRDSTLSTYTLKCEVMLGGRITSKFVSNLPIRITSPFKTLLSTSLPLPD